MSMARWLCNCRRWCCCCCGQSAPSNQPVSVPEFQEQRPTLEDLDSLPAFQEQRTTLEDLDSLLAGITQQLQVMEQQQAGQPSSWFNPITTAASQRDKYKSQTTNFMATVPDVVAAQIKESGTLFIMPLLTKALGDLGGVHWMAFGFSVVSWLLETVNTATENRESCIQLLRKTVDLLAYTKDVWSARRDGSDDALVSALQHSAEMAFCCAMVCCSTMQAGAIKDILRFVNAANINMSMSTVEKQLDEALRKIRSQLDRVIFKEVPRLKRDPSSLGVPGKLRVGGDGVIEDAIGFMDRNVGNVLLVALKGMGGIGKTTLGDAIFNRFMKKKNDDGKKQYRCCSVTLELGINETGLYKVQEEILEKLSKSRPIPITRLTDGVTQLRKELGNIKEPVFLYIDNVLKYGESWLPLASAFPKGSRILVTTRNKHVCNSLADKLELKEHQYSKLIEVKVLDDAQAKKLLHMQFRTQHEDYTTHQGMETLEKKVLELCAGLPLALAVVGGFIAQSDEGPKAAKVWQDVIDAMEQARPLDGEREDELYSKLRFSVDHLEKSCRQSFLDVVAYAVGRPWAAAERLVEPSILKILWERSLVSKEPPEIRDSDSDNVEYNGDDQIFDSSDYCVSRVGVHDVLVKMGKDMVKDDSEEIGVIDKDGYDMCADDQSMLAKVVGLMVDVTITAQQLQQMRNLRLIKRVTISGECTQVAKLGNLRIVSNVRAESNKALNFKGCKLKEISWEGSFATRWSMKDLQWENDSAAQHLQVLKIKLWEELQDVGDMHCFRSLKGLYIIHCTKLMRLSEAVGNWTALKRLHLSGCSSLALLPEAVGNWTAFTTLDLEGCQSLASLPEAVGNWTALTSLHLGLCESLASLPEAVGNWTALTRLNWGWCKSLASLPEAVGNWTALTSLDLAGCESLASLPEAVGNWTALTSLSLGMCKSLASLPEAVGNWTALRGLDLAWCWSLASLPEAVGNWRALRRLDLRKCWNLASLPAAVGNWTALTSLDLRGCESLASLPEAVGNWTALTRLDLEGCESLTSLPEAVGNWTALGVAMTN